MRRPYCLWVVCLAASLSAPERAWTAPQDAKLPDYEKELPERRPQSGLWSEIFFVNGIDESINIGLRSGVFGKNVTVSPRGAAHVKLPNGTYSLFYLVPKEPKKELNLRAAVDSINSPDGVAQLLKVDRAARGGRELPGGPPMPDNTPPQKKVPTLFEGNAITLKADNYVVTLSTVRGEALTEIRTETLNGVWTLVSAQRGGKNALDEFPKGYKLTIDGGNVTVQTGDRSRKGTLRLDAARTPKELDLVFPEGTLRAIYSLRGDELALSRSEVGEARPMELASKQGGKNVVMILKRDKE